MGFNGNNRQFTVDVQGKSAAQLHYKSPGREQQKEGYLPSINCFAPESKIELNDIVIYGADTNITWSYEDMCYRAENLLGNIYRVDINAVEWGPQVGSEFLEYLTAQAHPQGFKKLRLRQIPASIRYDATVIDRLSDKTAAVQEFGIRFDALG